MVRIIDIKPKAGIFLDDKPTIGNLRRETEDSTTLVARTLGAGSPIGPGWFMFLTYSESITVYA